MTEDRRNIGTGWKIPCESYCDQPYVVKTDDGGWLCVLTTGNGVEGEPGQHVVSTKSFDQGKTWSKLTDIEPAGGPEASWVMPLKVTSGRVYAFYVYNGDNMRTVISDQGPCKRVDTLGYLAYKYTDDSGATWSDKRYIVPMRKMRVDLENPYEGKVMFFWGVGKPCITSRGVYIGMAKVGRFGHGFMTCSEGVFIHSDNILTESDPAKIHWETLPDGDEGIKSPKGPIAEEHNLVEMADGSLYCTYRSTEGHNCHAYSRDGGHTWDGPQYASYAPGGKLLKHPRAANFVRKFSNGKYLLWFHNHGGKWYEDRNPVWLCGGVEKDGFIHWSQPEIALYDDDIDNIRMSYPDFVEEDGRYFATETQKHVARVHELDAAMLEGMWNQGVRADVAREALALELSGEMRSPGRQVDMPELPDLRERGGITIELRARFENLDAGQVLLDSRAEDGSGILLATTDRKTLRISLSDGRTENSWESDMGAVAKDAVQHIGIVIDGGPKVITFIVDGVLCDGGDDRQFGWGRFSPFMREVTGTCTLKVAPKVNGSLSLVRIYTRALRTSEMVGNWRSGR